MNQAAIIDLQSLETAPFNTASAALPPHLGLCSDSTAALAHDARNLITALGLYCDLIDEPGVLAAPFAHYGNELRMVAAAGHRLVSKLVARSESDTALSGGFLPKQQIAPWPSTASGKTSDMQSSAATAFVMQRPVFARLDSELASTPITNLAAELLASRNLLAALAGPGIAITVDAQGGARGVQLTAEGLTRILVNLVRNAADAMPSGGRIHISLSETSFTGQPSPAGAPTRLMLVFEDDGPGISSGLLDKIFDRGFTTHAPSSSDENWPAIHRGLGLAITRSIIESACGRIEVSNRPGSGARFSIELAAV